MSEVVVIDAGVALAWFIDPPGERKDYALSVLRAFQKQQITFIVPDIFFVEVPYALLKAKNKGLISESTVAQAARFIDVMTTDIVPSSYSIEESINRAVRWELKAYDATYFDLAVRMDVPLAAIDKDLVNKARKFSVPIWEPAQATKSKK
ncbi:type II toxin-antitoxin system VapC family toxin [Undibacterium sp.]|uniref:type II toxin-antitoxin system VapC family toxin n=1 Tax=Undibacterium sp. TaxID=1914977 RepID=UPI002C2AE349|nr:type II toxin-antitoxin system VapC family toxin [Undibacterium sp.]HTD06243.1 type II toxin-antitoxin system VapC family toxin [Undibacterium sp.]